MKKIFAAVLAGLLLAAALPFAANAQTVTINVYNWGQYISDGTDGYIDVNAAFTEATGIKVNYMTYDSNESLYTKMKTGGSDFDIIIPSDYMVARLIAEDMLLPINFDNVPNYKYIDEAFKNTDYDPANTYSVPYTWGTVGIIYNTKYVTKEVTGWDILWDEEYAGKILMFDNPRDAFGIAELCLGYSINTTDEAELRAAAEKLKQQKPLVQSYVMDQIFDAMEREEAWIAPYYAGDYLMMAEENPNLDFCFPEEGFNVFIDAICIPNTCQNKEAAEAYINFLCSPEISGRNLDYLGYSTPISEAKKYMSEETAQSGIAYPSDEVLSRAESFTYLPEEATQLMDSLWLEVKTSGGSGYTAYIVGACVALVVIVLLSLYSMQKKKRRRRNKKSAG
ncbi:MAG: ABC transporter substrate-binding protein [Oscillospiraceae bacterium]